MVALGVAMQCYETETGIVSVLGGLVWPVALGYAISKTTG
jgi:hypothetical protein